MKKRLSIILLMLILAVSLVSAADLEIKHTGPAYVQAGAEAIFVVSVENLGYKTETLNVHPDTLSMLPSSKFDYILLSENKIVLNAHEIKKFNVTIKLKDTVPTDENYGTYIKFTSPFDPELREEHGFILRVVPPEDILEMSVSAPARVQPGEEYKFLLNIKNNLNTQLHNVKLVVSSDLFETSKDLKFFALQDRTETFAFTIKPQASPEDHDLNIRMMYNGEIIERATASFEVLENSNIKEKRHETTGFLTKTYSIVKTNYGNSIVEEAYSVELTRFQKMFVKYSEDPTSTNGEVYWGFSLSPDESKTISATVNYRPLGIALLILVIFGFLAYYWLTKSLSIKKEILKVNETKEGISELKILLHIKNNTARTLRHLAVVEILPKVIEPAKAFGTLKPEKMQKGDKGVRMMWIIPELVRGEERIISYKAKSKINIVGTFLLGPAMVRFKNNSGKVVTIDSNNVRFTVGGVDNNEKAYK